MDGKNADCWTAYCRYLDFVADRDAASVVGLRFCDWIGMPIVDRCAGLWIHDAEGVVSRMVHDGVSSAGFEVPETRRTESSFDGCVVRDGVLHVGGDKLDCSRATEFESRSLDSMSKGVGKNYKKNKARAVRRKKGVETQVVDDSVVSSLSFSRRVGAFSDCSKEVQAELRTSRAEMLIAKNRADAAKARSYVRHADMVRKSRVDEKKFELGRQTVDEKLRKITEARFGPGFVEGSVSSSAATPGLSCGSVSPDSSISMAEVTRMESLVLSQGMRLVQLTKSLADMEVKSKDFEKKSLVKERELLSKLEKLRQEKLSLENRSRSYDDYMDHSSFV